MKVILVLVGSDILHELAIKVDSINASVISGCMKGQAYYSMRLCVSWTRYNYRTLVPDIPFMIVR